MTIPVICRQCGKLAFPGDIVTISAVEYEELLRFREARQDAHAQLASYRLAGRSRIARDPELANFIISCAETMLLAQIETACVERFGRDRVPSKSSIHRFIHGPASR